MANSKLSQRRKVLKQIEHAGATNDRKQFTFLLLNNRISRKVADEYYKRGQNLGKFIFNRQTLTIETKGTSNGK